MPPDLNRHQTPKGARRTGFDRTIPHFDAAKTRFWCDRWVTVQPAPFLAMPVIGIILWLRPEAADTALAAAGALVLAARRSQFRYRRIHTR
ncbi:hypothetical protein ACM614_24205 [Streptomyces sp. 12297]